MNTYVKICIIFGILLVFSGLSYLFIAKIKHKSHKFSHNIKHNFSHNIYENLPKCENNNCQSNYEENSIPIIYTNIPPPQEFPMYVERDYIIQRPLYRRPRRRSIFKALAQTKDEIKKDFRTYSKMK